MSAPDLRCVDLSRVTDLYSDNPVDTTSYRAAIEEAHRQGAVVHYRLRSQTTWTHNTRPIANWNWTTWLYRLDPASRPRRPWSRPEDVPGPVVWVRYRGEGSGSSTLVSLGAKGIGVIASRMGLPTLFDIPWSDLSHYEHSVDGRRTWLPCSTL